MSTHVELRSAAPARLTWQQGLAAYLPARYRAVGERLASELPLLFVLFVVALLAMTISRPTAFIDEALYINAGYDYLEHWFAGGPYVDHALQLSGVPVVYPVIAAAIDSIGGLWLVRVFSTLLIASIIVSVTLTSRHLSGYRTSMFTAAALGFIAPVIFLAQLATHDALSLALLVFAVYLAVTRSSFRSAVSIGVLVAAAAAVKYTAAAFIPAVFGLMVFTAGNWRRAVSRPALAVLATISVFAVGSQLVGDTVIEAIGRTTFNRADGFGVIAPADTQQLLALVGANVGILVQLALFGALQSRSWRRVAVATTLIGAAVLLPAGQIILGELSSFDKHLGYTAIFLAPLAGIGLERLSRGTFLLAPPMFLLITMLFMADMRASTLVFWADIAPVVEIIASEPVPGTYLSSQATTFAYHLRDDQDIDWFETFDFWDLDAIDVDLIEASVADGRFARVILRGDDTGNPQQNVAQRILVDALVADPRYDLERTDEGERGWRVFTLDEGAS